jgi:hypothetical protein
MHIWSHARGNFGFGRTASWVSGRAQNGIFLGGAAMKNSRLVLVADQGAKADHSCASGMS